MNFQVFNLSDGQQIPVQQSDFIKLDSLQVVAGNKKVTVDSIQDLDVSESDFKAIVNGDMTMPDSPDTINGNVSAMPNTDTTSANQPENN